MLPLAAWSAGQQLLPWQLVPGLGGFSLLPAILWKKYLQQLFPCSSSCQHTGAWLVHLSFDLTHQLSCQQCQHHYYWEFKVPIYSSGDYSGAHLFKRKKIFKIQLIPEFCYTITLPKFSRKIPLMAEERGCVTFEILRLNVKLHSFMKLCKHKFFWCLML